MHYLPGESVTLAVWDTGRFVYLVLYNYNLPTDMHYLPGECVTLAVWDTGIFVYLVLYNYNHPTDMHYLARWEC